MPKQTIPHEEYENIRKLYLDGKSIILIAKLYNVSYNPINRIISDMGIMRSASDRHRKYSFDESYFDKIDTHIKAYLYGLYLADGYNATQQNKIRLSLHKQDYVLLERIKEILKYTGPIYNKDKVNQSELTIFSKKVSERFTELGIIRAKTFKTKFPEWLNERFYNSFILGYFDGDGCISIQEKLYNKGNFSITGTTDLLYPIGEILKKQLEINCYFNKRHKKRDNNIISLVVCGNQQIIKIGEWLYKDCALFLNRKKVKFDYLKEVDTNKKQNILNKKLKIEEYNNVKAETRRIFEEKYLLTINKILELYNENLSIRQIYDYIKSHDYCKIGRHSISSIIKNSNIIIRDRMFYENFRLEKLKSYNESRINNR